MSSFLTKIVQTKTSASCVYKRQLPQIPICTLHGTSITYSQCEYVGLFYLCLLVFGIHRFYWQTGCCYRCAYGISGVLKCLLLAKLVKMFYPIIWIILLVKHQSPTQTHAHLKLRNTTLNSVHNDLHKWCKHGCHDSITALL